MRGIERGLIGSELVLCLRLQHGNVFVVLDELAQALIAFLNAEKLRGGFEHDGKTGSVKFDRGALAIFNAEVGGKFGS